MPTTPAPPLSADDLLARARRLGGLSLAEIARLFGEPVPANLKRQKGWMGQLLEKALGATSGSAAEPDFPQWGIELKTLPISPEGKVLESTYVCVAPLRDMSGLVFESSLLAAKLRKVLFLPVIGHRGWPPGERRVGQPFLWEPNQRQWQRIKADFEELTGLIATGQVDRITAHQGEVLQIRPKAANARARTMGTNLSGETVWTLPRGFYLRAHFTQSILQQAFSLTPPDKLDER
jgi:DNA mismatch repair protein MutH